MWSCKRRETCASKARKMKKKELVLLPQVFVSRFCALGHPPPLLLQPKGDDEVGGLIGPHYNLGGD
ncbi:hypothetical protein OUZ56_014014 [Daphnia magna]|uniref:Uncharacterized protein n=1 Tax=Daphnia magna TaxID=35525 RepID=A0ABQ9Z7M9_9CRUS|nr:hypothetical protein OUZ56_014014 [Daphnia magna]